MAEALRKRRVDAERNRERLLESARVLFRTRGTEVPMREVARAAGVGTATVHRHFATRDDLLHAVLSDQIAACEARMRDLVVDPDPARALRDVVRWFADLQLQDRAVAAALLTSTDAAFAEVRRQHSRLLEQLVDRARAAGVLRHGTDVRDVRALLVALSGLGALPSDRARDAADRVIGLALAGLVSAGSPETP